VTAPHVVVVGAGMGGLAAAVDLARQGAQVTVLERAARPGGKMRTVRAGDFDIDAGPTVFTMRWVFDALFDDAGASLTDRLALQPAQLLARHAWRQGGQLDLHADVEASVDAIGAFAGAREADGYRRFVARSREIFETLRSPFIASEKPNSPLDLVARLGLTGIPALSRTAPMSALWQALGHYFRDPRLRQLFGRYSTYVGSSPLQAPATLMLIAHVEQQGVWLVRGGMHEVARQLQRLAEQHGASFRFDSHVSRICTDGGRVGAIELDDGQRFEADAVVFNGDASALGAGLLGAGARRGADVTRPAQRSLSAVTWCVAARPQGFPLVHHNVFFGEDYPREFERIFRDRTITEHPTVYICAQRRPAGAPPVGDGGDAPAPEPLLILINAPADGDGGDGRAASLPVDEVRRRGFALMSQCGLTFDDAEIDAGVLTDPVAFNGLFPGTGGALYGRANHGPFASFERPGARTHVPGLYLAGGSAHPGAGVPMTAMSGRIAAARVLADLRAGGRARGAVSVATGAG
jgi:1-hydroxycarotenoid 3,4-desaturase